MEVGIGAEALGVVEVEGEGGDDEAEEDSCGGDGLDDEGVHGR